MWKDIKTVPKNGDIVLLWVGECVLASWYAPWRTWLRESDPEPSNSYIDEVYGIEENIPTHWQPLPKPPNKAFQANC